MNISLSTSVAGGPVSTRPLASEQRSLDKVAQDKPEVPERKKRDPMARLAAANTRSQRRVQGNIDKASLSPRQQAALDKVEKQFESMNKRLDAAMKSEGVDRSDLRKGLDTIYGSLRDSLSDILAASERQRPTAGNVPEQFSGLVLNRLA